MDRDLEDDMRNAQWFMEKIRNKPYAQNIYAALCNMRWQVREVMPVLKDEYWSCSWRAAGGIVSKLRGEGDYMDWYCSGMGGLAALPDDDEEALAAQFEARGYAREGEVTNEVREDLLKLGWQPSEWPND